MHMKQKPEGYVTQKNLTKKDILIGWFHNEYSKKLQKNSAYYRNITAQIQFVIQIAFLTTNEFLHTNV